MRTRPEFSVGFFKSTIDTHNEYLFIKYEYITAIFNKNTTKVFLA